jgi:hypothetical protein
MAMSPNDPLRNPLDPEVPFPDRARTPRDIDNQLQIDPELDEGRASGGRIALYGLAVLAVLGAIFYGLNSSPTNTTASNPTPSTTAQTSPATPMAPGNLNTAPGTTTGAAPAPRPAPPMNNNMNDNTVQPGTTTPRAQ